LIQLESDGLCLHRVIVKDKDKDNWDFVNLSLRATTPRLGYYAKLIRSWRSVCITGECWPGETTGVAAAAAGVGSNANFSPVYLLSATSAWLQCETSHRVVLIKTTTTMLSVGALSDIATVVGVENQVNGVVSGQGNIGQTTDESR